MTARVPRAMLVSGVVLALIAGCGDDDGDSSAPRPTRTTLGLSSSAFLEGSRIPARYTCDGADLSPPLTWTRVPARAQSLALVMDDQDTPGGAFLHWSLWDIARGASGVKAGGIPPGAVQGANSFGRTGYGGPCPPRGDDSHRYRFRLYALDATLGLQAGAKPDDVREAIDAHAITTGSLTGLYSR